MIFLLNRDYILWESVELARLHMCEVLRIPVSAVDASIAFKGGVAHPEFNVDMDACKGVSKEAVIEVIKKAYTDCKGEMAGRSEWVFLTRAQVLDKMYGDHEKKDDQEGA